MRLRSSSDAQREGNEHRRNGAFPPNHRSHAPHVGRIAQAEILVTDALAARQQAIGELFGRKRRITGDVLEPFRRVARGVLQLEHLELARRLVTSSEAARSEAAAAASASARPMASSIASFVPEPTEKCAVCAASPMSTTFPSIHALVGHAREVQPVAAAQVRAVGHQPVAVQIRREKPFAERERLRRFGADRARAPATSPRGTRR